jgi:uncharacterized protein
MHGGAKFSSPFRLLIAASTAAVIGLTGAAEPSRNDITIQDLTIRAQAGDKTATRQLAEAYYLGRGVEQDIARAAQLYERLAKQGDAWAQTIVGLMYARGYGVEKNLDSARKWWSLAAAQDEPGAQYNLAVLYSEGRGVPNDNAQAAQWYTRAATRGHIQAQYNLGLCYFEGRGVSKDLIRSYYWLAVAAQQGDETARAMLPKVAAQMTEAQVREAQAEAKEWMRNAKKIWWQ